jgi:hypothetical protein
LRHLRPPFLAHQQVLLDRRGVGADQPAQGVQLQVVQRHPEAAEEVNGFQPV